MTSQKKKLLTTTFVSIALLVSSTLSNAFEFRRGESFFDIWCASCRVSVPGARGSGLFCGTYKGTPYIITNYHVVEQNGEATLQFRTNGYPQEITGRISTRLYNAGVPTDYALVRVNEAELARINPPFIPLAGSDAAPTVNSFILSSGCPKGRFVQAWKGRVLGYYNGETALFEPGPVPGQSGSAIISEIDGELWMTGILTWLIGQEGADDAKGGAIPIAKLYQAARGRQTSTPSGTSPIPPNAVECSIDDDGDLYEIAAKANGPFVLEFTRNNCQPCEAAKKDVDAIKEAGFEVYTFNVSTSKDGARRAEALRVAAYPTFFLFTQDGERVGKYIGAGHASEIIAAAEKELEPPAPQVDETPFEIVPSPAPTYDEELLGDFRMRPVVVEISDEGFLEESDARWRARGQKKKDEEPEEEEKAPREKEKTPSIVLGAGVLDKVEKNLGERLDRIIEEKSATLTETILEKVMAYKEKATRLIFRAFFFAALLGGIISGLFSKFIGAIWSGIVALFKTLINKEAKRIAKAAARVEKFTSDAIADIDAGLDDIQGAKK